MGQFSGCGHQFRIFRNINYIEAIGIGLGLLSGCDQPKKEGSEAQSYELPANFAPDPYNAKAPASAGFKLPEGTLDNVTLGDFVKTKRDSSGGDAFSKGFDDGALAGRKFVVSIPLSQRETAAVWGYDKDKGILLLELDMEYTADMNGQMATFQSSRDALPPKIMENAFGVTVNVSRSDHWSIGVGTTSGYTGIIPIDDMLTSSDRTAYGYLTTELKMPSDKARASIEGMTLQIEGVVTKNKSGHTIECSQRTTEPKIDQTNESNLNTCIVQSKFKKISFITKSGKTLKEWQQR